MDGMKVMVVDDESTSRDLLSTVLGREGYQVSTAQDGEEAMGLLENESFDLVITDLKMPRADGLQVLKKAKQVDPNTACIVVTGFATIETAVVAMKEGAYDYISKPFQVDEIKIIAQRALEYHRMQGENVHLRKQIRTKYRFDNIVGDSEQMHDLFRMVEKVADSDSTILLQGESGTGKELIAKAIHYNSHRNNKLLIPVNCGAIPEDLLESELFGHVKGAFTGAIYTRQGRFQMASGGTIFLDEIGDMSPKLQVKVLRVLQEHEFEPVGGTETIKVDVRVITATNQNLEEAVKAKTFREDLFYRLNVIPLTIPPLRDRKADVPLLVNHFLERFNREKNRKIRELDKDSMELLLNYAWPGNVRELENLIERLVILNDKDVINTVDLPDKFLQKPVKKEVSAEFEIPGEGISFKKVVNDFENRLILQALNKTGWNKNMAAKLLKLNRTTLVEKIKKKRLNRLVEH